MLNEPGPYRSVQPDLQQINHTLTEENRRQSQTIRLLSGLIVLTVVCFALLSISSLSHSNDSIPSRSASMRTCQLSVNEPRHITVTRIRQVYLVILAGPRGPISEIQTLANDDIVLVDIDTPPSRPLYDTLESTLWVPALTVHFPSTLQLSHPTTYLEEQEHHNDSDASDAD